MWVRGLKLEYWLYTCRLSVSHPMWVRGLKLTYVADFDEVEMSHPMWVRGLKLQIHTSKRGRRHVAPYVGAWIETAYEYGLLKITGVAPYVGAWIETRKLCEIQRT